MTVQLCRRRAGKPVRVWRVGEGEPPEWVVVAWAPLIDVWRNTHFGWFLVEGEALVAPSVFLALYESLCSPSVDALLELEKVIAERDRLVSVLAIIHAEANRKLRSVPYECRPPLQSIRDRSGAAIKPYIGQPRDEAAVPSNQHLQGAS